MHCAANTRKRRTIAGVRLIRLAVVQSQRSIPMITCAFAAHKRLLAHESPQMPKLAMLYAATRPPQRQTMTGEHFCSDFVERPLDFLYEVIHLSLVLGYAN